MCVEVRTGEERESWGFSSTPRRLPGVHPGLGPGVATIRGRVTQHGTRNKEIPLILEITGLRDVLMSSWPVN